jgi:altronate hydrolase
VKALLPEANKAVRKTAPASHITLGLQCGGSDGYSGISANPALGAAVDMLVRHGGSAMLSETPEVYGAEHLLTRRAVTREVGEKLVKRIKWWEDYTERLGGEMNNNPSPGNKAGGLTTILEKSLGAVAKGGTTAMVDVLEYAQRATQEGFMFMDSPGYDPVSATGQVASGANMICFTTGRGSAYGCKPAPSLKLATNSALYMRQEEDMDINCGVDRRWQGVHPAGRPTVLRTDPEDGLRREVEERAVGLRRGRVRALGARPDDVISSGRGAFRAPRPEAPSHPDAASPGSTA